MAAKHQTAEYQRNARIIKARVKLAWSRGHPVVCWRCRLPIAPGTKYDVGHLPGAQRSALHELAPEHRSKTAHCAGNRNTGGRIGAHITNSRRTVVVSPGNGVETWPI